MTAQRLDGFMRETQQQEEVFGLMKKKDSESLTKERKLMRDDSAAKNIVQMKSVPLSVFG